MFEPDIAVNHLLLQYAGMLLADIGDERMAEQPMSGVNHPAWIVGHVTLTADNAVALLGGEKKLDEKWKQQYGMGSQTTSNRADYPSKAELIATLEERFAKACELAAAATPEQVSGPNPVAQLSATLPTIRDLISFLLTGHLGTHLGQLSMWRRMIGLPPLF